MTLVKVEMTRIRRWFMRKDDFTLWAIAVVWVIAMFGAALWIVTMMAKVVAALLGAR